jgi:hypothetical protein
MMRAMMSVAVVALEFACASAGHIPAVQSEYWKDENFAAYERYAWLPSDAHLRERTQAEDHRLHDLIREAIDERLTGMGFVRSRASDADFLVTYHCRISEQIQVDLIDRVWYGSGDSEEWEEVTPRMELSPFDEGSIVIDFAKPASGKRVWRGVARGRVSLGATPEQYEEIVDRSVREILNEFPPEGRK